MRMEKLMRRAARVIALILSATGAGLLSCARAAAADTAKAQDRQNIVFILADDLGPGDLGCYGQKLIRTPNVDRLAEQGMRFTQVYCGSTVCAASRWALMTGY